MSLLQKIGITSAPQEVKRAGGTDNEMWSAAQSIASVGTAPTITHYEDRSASQNEELEQELKIQKGFTKEWGRCLNLNLRWQQEDLTRTQQWADWALQTTGNLTTKARIVVKTLAQQQAMVAKATAQSSADIGLIGARTEKQVSAIGDRLQAQIAKIKSGEEDDD